MSPAVFHKVLVSALIAVLHAPLVYFAFQLYGQLAPYESVADLPLMSLVTLIALVVAPHILLAWFNIRWNPPWARSNEIDAWDCRPKPDKDRIIAAAATRLAGHN
ncbi:hypothetical protein [Thiosocius teredinicola]|uniref:hypothetical protein n=1 Tax=Thiosocius teredinicola TaxID=1973002 RepID=UPI000F7B5BD4